MALISSSSCLCSASYTRAYGLPRLPGLGFKKAAQATRSLPSKKQDPSTRLDSLSNGWPFQCISYRGESLSDIAETLQVCLREEGYDSSETATPLGLGGLITPFSLAANFLMVNAAFAVTQEKVHILTQNIISWIIVSFIYFIVVPEVNIHSKLNLLECNISKKVLNNKATVDVLKIATTNDSQSQQVPATKGRPTWNFKRGAAVAAIALLTGPFLCHHALAGTEVASVQDSATWLGDLNDIKSGFVSAFLLIFFSEIGDKTFFIAALLASRKSNAAVFTGTFGALVAMTFISVFLGRTFHYIDGILPFSLGENDVPLDDLAAVVLLVYFGVSTLVDAASMEGSKAEEEQQEAELAVAGIAVNGGGSAVANTALATFALVFVAEWGDKSFFSTVALSAASSPLGVVTGAVVGHGIATLIAVLGGSFLSTYVSEKVIAYTGGVLFLVFAAVTLVGILQ